MTPEILTRKTNGVAGVIPAMPKPDKSQSEKPQPAKLQSLESLADNWREGAMFEVLQHFEEDERPGALLGLIRRHQPALDAMVIGFDRERLQEFFKAHSDSCRSLLEGQSWRGGHWDTFDHWPYLSWHTVRWNGGEFEIALPPSTCSFDDAIVLANGTQPLQTFVQELIDWCERPTGRALRYSHGWDSAPDLDEQLGKVTWDDIVFAPKVLQSLREAVEGFFSHREAYRALGFAWRRGVLLVGPPGTGKTMICKAIAGATPDLPFLYVRDLRERNQKDAIRDIFNRARKLAPCVLAFEDVDGFICDANRTAFLNEMDGFHSNDGLLVIASSNHPGKIDEAMLKRPSRFDRVFHIGLPDEAERAEYARRLMSRSSLAAHIAESLDCEQLAVEVAAKSKGFTPAYIKEAFTAAALQRAQNGAMVLDADFATAVLVQVAELKAHLKRLKNPDALAEMSNGEDVIGFRR